MNELEVLLTKFSSTSFISSCQLLIIKFPRHVFSLLEDVLTLCVAEHFKTGPLVTRFGGLPCRALQMNMFTRLRHTMTLASTRAQTPRLKVQCANHIRAVCLYCVDHNLVRCYLEELITDLHTHVQNRVQE